MGLKCRVKIWVSHLKSATGSWKESGRLKKRIRLFQMVETAYVRTHRPIVDRILGTCRRCSSGEWNGLHMTRLFIIFIKLNKTQFDIVPHKCNANSETLHSAYLIAWIVVRVFYFCRDLFYELYRDWESSHARSDWSMKLYQQSSRIHGLTASSIDLTNQLHFVRIFILQLIKVCFTPVR